MSTKLYNSFCIILFFVFQIASNDSFGQALLLNEVSNGGTGSQEFVELIVSGTCGQTLDIRGYYLDDNCSTASGVGTSPGCAKFTNDLQWAAVPAGTLIIVYNGDDINPTLPAADPTDSNCDGVYVIAITANVSNPYIQTQGTAVGGCNASNYTSTVGYDINNNWSRIGLGNTADLFQVRDASGNAVMSVGYGTGIASPGGTFISFTGTGGNRTYQHVSSDPLIQANWVNNAATPVSATSQSPGTPNSCVNAVWMENIRVVDGLTSNPNNWCDFNYISLSNNCTPFTLNFQNPCLPNSYTWNSSNPLVGTITPGGLPLGRTAMFAPQGNGSTTLTATATKTFSALFTGPNTSGCSATPKTITQTQVVNVMGCVAPCAISSISFSNIGSCNDNGTPLNPNDDYFTANITVTFANPPASGTLDLTGDVLAGGGPLSLSAPFISPLTFTGVRLKADGTASVVTATFSASGSCTFTENNGPTVNSCSVPPCNISGISFANIGSCNDNGTPLNPNDDYFTANITVTFVNPPASGTLDLTGDVLAGGGPLSLSAPFVSPLTFTGVRLRADGTASVVTATFSASGSCTFTESNGPNVSSCSVPPCNISGLAFSNISLCNDNGTPLNPNDDYFTSNLTVTFTNPPVTGTLDLTGDVLMGGGPLSISAPFISPLTFTGVRLKADGTASVVTATFSSAGSCTFTENNGPSVNSCSNATPCPMLSTMVMNTTCGLNNGAIDLSLSGGIGPFTFIWSNGSMNEDISNLSSGNYSVTITSASCPGGVVTSAFVGSSVNPNPSLSTSVTNASCGLNNGAINLTTTGGVSPFSFIWSNGAITEDISGLASGMYSVTVTATGTGCTGVSTSAFVGIIADNQPPMLTCPGDITVSCSDLVPVPNPATVTATDNCTNPLTVTFVSDVISNQTCTNKYKLTRTYQAIDGAGNVGSCQQIITVNDITLPVFTTNPLPVDVTLSCELPVPPSQVLAASDNCGAAVNVTFNEVTTQGNCISRKVITRTWTATDNCNNTRTHVQVITVVDNTAPVFTPPLPANVTISCDNIPTAPVLTATDNCTGVTPPPIPVLWINEMHYDNTGADVGEFVEVAGTAGINLSDYSLILYNGANGQSYDTKLLSGTIPNESNGFGAAAFTYPSNGVQNGSPDGVALVYNPTNTVLYFLSYEGVFIATNGPANGQTSVDIGVFEAGTEAIGLSLRLTGTGSNYSAFSWQAPAAQSPGLLNQGQTMVNNSPPSTGQITYTFNETKTVGSCPNAGTIARTWTATDACGNTSTYTQTITVIDNTPPVFVQPLPVDVTVECDAIPAVPTVLAIDNCGPLNAMSSPVVWINEIHYDNLGADVGEFIEVAGTAGLNLSGYTLVLYNGANGQQYTTTILSGIIPNQSNGYGALAFNYPTDGIQNGAPDGLALVQGANVIQFLSYEGVFTAVDGPAIGLNSVNIGVQENGSDPVGLSLQLKGNGNKYSDFIWSAPSAQSPGLINVGQVMGPVVITAVLSSSFTPSGCPQGGLLKRTWTATDACGNSSVYTQNITVRDTKAPTFIGTVPQDITIECDQTVPVAPILTATDNCDTNVPVGFTSTTTPGSCPQSSTIKRVYSAIDDCGNSTMHMYTITIRDTKAPTFVGNLPQNITIECDQPVPVAPTLTAIDNCASNITVSLSSVTTPGSCPQESTIKRTYTAADPCGNSTMHMYTITIKDTKAPSFVGTFPQNITIECDQVIPPVPVITAVDNCAPNIPVILTVTTTSGKCAQESIIKRSFTASDPCGNSTMFMYTITIVDTKPPVINNVGSDFIIECDQPVPASNMVTAVDNCDPKPILTLVEKSTKSPYPTLCAYFNYAITRTYTATDACGNQSVKTQTIKVQDTTAPLFTMIPPADVTLQCDENEDHSCPGAIDNCDLNATVILDFKYKPVPDGCANSYIVQRLWTAGDRCGNVAFLTQNVLVVDTEAPEIICPGNITKTSNVPVVVTWPAAKAGDYCDGPTPTVLIAGPVSGSLFLPNTKTVIVYQATDECGNQSTCSFTISITDSGPTPNGSKISGSILTPEGKSIQNVDVIMSGDVKQFINSMGTYSFDNLPNSSKIIITPKKDNQDLNGVNTLDLVYITNHILGKKALDSPYKMLAADVTNDSKITTADLVQIRKLILHVIDKFENKDSWTFGLKDHKFSNQYNPFIEPMPFFKQFDEFKKDEIVDFIGLKTGDVTWDANTSLMDGSAEIRTEKKMKLQIANQFMEEGDLINVPFELSDNESLKGLQFTVGFDTSKLEFVGVNSLNEGISPESFGLRYISSGYLTASFDRISQIPGGNFFEIIFKAKKTGSLKDYINVCSILTPAQAYNHEDEIFDVELVFEGERNENLSNDILLFQNEPNPFENSSIIRFVLPEKSFATLTILNNQGVEIKKFEKVFEKGMNKVSLDAASLPAPGMYHFRLKCQETVITKKMIFVR